MSYKQIVICQRDYIGKCDHETFPGIYHIDIRTPGFHHCTVYGLDETSMVLRSSDWPKFYPPYSDVPIDRQKGSDAKKEE